MNQEPKIKEPRRYLDKELLAEVFGFVPIEATDDIYNLVNFIFFRLMEGIAKSIVELYPDKQRAIVGAIVDYESAVETKIDELFNVFQQYISQHVWKIPQDMNIQHEHHEGLNFTVKQSDIDNIDEQIKQTREKIIAQKKLKAVLLQMEQKKVTQVKELDQHLEKLAFLDDIPQEENVQDVGELLKIIKKEIEQEKEVVIRQLACQEELTSAESKEKEDAKECRAAIDRDIRQSPN